MVHRATADRATVVTIVIVAIVPMIMLVSWGRPMTTATAATTVAATSASTSAAIPWVSDDPREAALALGGVQFLLDVLDMRLHRALHVGAHRDHRRGCHGDQDRILQYALTTGVRVPSEVHGSSGVSTGATTGALE